MATHHPFVSANSSPTSNGTPGTKLTEFSPEDFRSDAKLPHEVARAVQPPAFALQGLEEAVTVVHQGPSVLVAGLQDPFTSTPASSKIEGTRLSPRATTFKPLQASYSVPNLQSRDQGPGDAVPSSMKARGITRYLRISKVLKTSSIADLNRAFNVSQST